MACHNIYKGVTILILQAFRIELGPNPNLLQLSNKGLLYLAMGIVSEEEGAPCFMAGGSYQAYSNVQDIFTKVAAQVDDGPCVTYVGEGGSGTLVAMVHIAIQYGHLYLVSEACHILKDGCGLSNSQLVDVLAEWSRVPDCSNRRELESFLFEISKGGGGDGYLVDKILHRTGTKDIRKWTAHQLAGFLSAVPTITSSLDFSLMEEERVKNAPNMLEEELFGFARSGVEVGNKWLIDDVKQALYALNICTYYAQWMNLLRAKSDEKGWNLNLGELARIWKGVGCSARALFLDRISKAYQRNPNLPSLILDPEFAKWFRDIRP